MKVVNVRNKMIGIGTPKLCVSLVGRTKQEIQQELVLISKKYVDIVEWRLDFFEYSNQLNHVIEMLTYIRASLDDIPLMLTLRTLSQGGSKEIEEKQYTTLLHHVMKSDYVDMIDIEYNANELQIKNLIVQAHTYQKKVILSHHDFKKTPSYEELIELWKRMQLMGSDIVKVAVMPKDYVDVSTLMKASFFMHKWYAKQPIVAISMSSLGSVSRVCAQAIGSAITFASLHTPSAPGQWNVKEMKYMLESLENIHLSH